MENNAKELKIENKVVVINKAPATVAFDIALRYSSALGANPDPVVIQDCMYSLLRYAKIILQDGRELLLDNKEIINQHFSSPKSLMELQKAAIALNFDFLVGGATSDS